MNRLQSPRRFLAALAILACARPAPAHNPIYGIGTQTRVIVREDRVVLVFDLSYAGSWAQGEMISMDIDKDSVVEREEADAYQDKRWKEKAAQALRCWIDEEEIELRLLERRHEGLVGEIYPGLFSLYYTLEARPSERFRSGEKHQLRIEDLVIRGETVGKPSFLVPYRGHGDDGALRFRPRFLEPPAPMMDPENYILEGEELLMEFDFTRPLEGDPGAEDGSLEEGADGAGKKGPTRSPGRAEAPELAGESSPVPPPAAGSAAEKDRRAADLFGDAVARPHELSLWGIASLLLLATLYGAGHAFTPGHGKTMVAAYLIGTRGRIRDAVILGLTTTFTHTITVYALGSVLLAAAHISTRSEGNLRNMAIVATSVASGLFLMGLGLILFFRRYRRLQLGLEALAEHSHDHGHSHGHGDHRGHSHHHGHAHEHTHSHGDRRSDDPHSSPPAGASQDLFPGERPRLRELLALGFSGGMLPCPAGLTVIAIGLQYPDRFLLAFLFLVCFSIGLGAVLVSIGVVLITGKTLARGSAKEGAFFQEIGWLKSIFSSAFLASLDRAGAHLVRVMPAFSCLVIVALGTFFAASTALRGRNELLAMLGAVTDWLGF